MAAAPSREHAGTLQATDSVSNALSDRDTRCWSANPQVLRGACNLSHPTTIHHPPSSS